MVFTNDYIEGLLAAVSEDSPTGENIEYDPDFLALEAMLPETTEAIFDGAQTENTDWRGIMNAAEALLARSKHLPTAVILTAGLVEIRNFTGLRDGLCLIANMLDRYWETFWPQLDPEDPEPIERESALSSLSPPLGAYEDPIAIPQRLRDTTIIQGRQAGILTLRGITDAPDPDKNQAAPEIVLPDADPTEVSDCLDAAEQSLEALTSIKNTFSEKTSAVAMLDFAVLEQELQEIQRTFASFLGAPAVGSDDDGSAEDGEGGGVPNTIQSRSDVIKSLDRISSWYENNEPGSPIPLLINQIRGMVNMRFSELMQEIYPEAVSGSRLMVTKTDEE